MVYFMELAYLRTTRAHFVCVHAKSSYLICLGPYPIEPIRPLVEHFRIPLQQRFWHLVYLTTLLARYLALAYITHVM